MLTAATILLLVIYGLLLLYVLARLFLYRPVQPVSAVNPPSLSVVVPFKNEAENLGTLLASLADQDYGAPWEIVLVNDESVDGFRPVVERFFPTFGGRLRCLESGRDPAAGGLTSKQVALDTGIESAAYDWIVLTDADMTFEKGWLSSVASAALEDSKGLDLGFGHTAIRCARHGFFEFCQRFQLEFLFASAYAFHAGFLDASCMGNNILVRKKAYLDIGGQSAIGYSIVEDRDLYRKFVVRGLRVGPLEPFRAMAFTAPCKTPRQFYHQMLRWARGGFSRSPVLLGAALLFTFQNIVLVASACGMAPRGAVWAAIANFFLTTAFMSLAFRKIRSRENVLFLPLYLVFALIEAGAFCISFIATPRVTWKEKKV
jgi:cellulose synthase/poly-beta-1,6-N-acetylglucosamine synthase-like glycosyltransferase